MSEIRRKRKENPSDNASGSASSAASAAAAFFPSAASSISSSSASSAASSSPFTDSSKAAQATPAVPTLESFLSPLNPALHSQLQNELLSVFFPSVKSHGSHMFRQLPGPQPFSMVHRDLATLQANEYWVCEKSDGERAMLYMNRERGATYLIDRKFLIKQLKHPIYVDLWASSTGDSLFDGELVMPEHLPTGTPGPQASFVIFDVLLLNGQRILDKKLSERLAAIGSGIVKPYRTRFPQYVTFLTEHAVVNPDDGSDHPLAIRAKAFHPKQHLRQILDFIKQIPGTDEYEYNDGKRRNKNDGVIFTPENDDYMCANVRLFKWKWPGLNTIDFQCRAPWFDDEGRLMLYTNANLPSEREGSRGQTVSVHYRSTYLIPEKRNWFMREINGKSSAIVEMNYSVKSSSWVPKLFRWDKSQPNFLTTVAGTVETIIDNILPPDLYAACLKKGSAPPPPSSSSAAASHQQQQHHHQQQAPRPMGPPQPSINTALQKQLSVNSHLWSSGASVSEANGVANPNSPVFPTSVPFTFGAVGPALSLAQSVNSAGASSSPSAAIASSLKAESNNSNSSRDTSATASTPHVPVPTIDTSVGSKWSFVFQQIGSRRNVTPFVPVSGVFGD